MCRENMDLYQRLPGNQLLGLQLFSLLRLDANLIEGELYNRLARKDTTTTKVTHQNLNF